MTDGGEVVDCHGEFCCKIGGGGGSDVVLLAMVADVWDGVEGWEDRFPAEFDCGGNPGGRGVVDGFGGCCGSEE